MELFGLNIHFPVTDPTWIFFLVLIIILFAPMILGRLRIPHIIGMILAGVLVGKYGFNIWSEIAVSSYSEKWDCIISCFWRGWRWIWMTLKRTKQRDWSLGCSLS